MFFFQIFSIFLKEGFLRVSVLYSSPLPSVRTGISKNLVVLLCYRNYIYIYRNYSHVIRIKPERVVNLGEKDTI